MTSTWFRVCICRESTEFRFIIFNSWRSNNLCCTYKEHRKKCLDVWGDYTILIYIKFELWEQELYIIFRFKIISNFMKISGLIMLQQWTFLKYQTYFRTRAKWVVKAYTNSRIIQYHYCSFKIAIFKRSTFWEYNLAFISILGVEVSATPSFIMRRRFEYYPISTIFRFKLYLKSLKLLMLS